MTGDDLNEKHAPKGWSSHGSAVFLLFYMFRPGQFPKIFTPNYHIESCGTCMEY